MRSDERLHPIWNVFQISVGFGGSGAVITDSCGANLWTKFSSPTVFEHLVVFGCRHFPYCLHFLRINTQAVLRNDKSKVGDWVYFQFLFLLVQLYISLQASLKKCFKFHIMVFLCFLVIVSTSIYQYVIMDRLDTIKSFQCFFHLSLEFLWGGRYAKGHPHPSLFSPGVWVKWWDNCSSHPWLRTKRKYLCLA